MAFHAVKCPWPDRGTGRTTWLKQVLPGALWFDLLRTQVVVELSRLPESFRQRVEARAPGTWVVVDEVQRLPSLLNEVHALIADHPRVWRFALSGSSARKLKRMDVNLLAGRAVNRQFFPLTASELGFDVSVDRVLRFGLLPQVHMEGDHAVDILDAYVARLERWRHPRSPVDFRTDVAQPRIEARTDGRRAQLAVGEERPAEHQGHNDDVR